MSGESVAYHLRYNKYIERRVFSELLLKLHRYSDISAYEYVGFGGIFLEDFKAMHADFNIKKMTSIEMSSHIHSRQKYNKPVKCITCVNITSGDFITDYDNYVKKNAVIWLDYASPKHIKSQMLEIESLISKMKNLDILKVTFNANIESLYAAPKGVSPPEPVFTVRQKRFEKLRGRLQDLTVAIDGIFSDKNMTQEDYPFIILTILEFVIKRALISQPDYTVIPLCNVKYADSQHIMLTFTGILIKKSQVKSFLINTKIDKWPYYSEGYAKIQEINVPILTTKERSYIDSKLPNHGPKVIARQIPFTLGKDEDKNVDLISNYARYYRHYPNFLKVTL